MHLTKIFPVCHRDGCTSGLFGYNHIKPDDKSVIITQSVMDALAVHQGSGKSVLSLPHHVSGSPTIPQEVRIEYIIEVTSVTMAMCLSCTLVIHPSFST